MNKTVVYCVLAVILGASVVLVPLMMLTKASSENVHFMPEFDSARSAFGTDRIASSSSEVEILGTSFTFALVGYIIIKTKTSRRQRDGL